jgi:hypothetical protein
MTTKGTVRRLRHAADALEIVASEWTEEAQDCFDHSSTAIREAFGFSIEETAAIVRAFAAELQRAGREG